MNETIKNGFLQMAKDLKTSKKKQIKHRLVEVVPKYEDRKEANYSPNKVAGYCAWGMLGCKNGVFDGMTLYEANETDYEQILAKYGIRKKLFTYIPERGSYSILVSNIFQSLDSVIVHMNDSMGMTFKEIGEYIEDMVNTGRIFIKA